MMKKIINNYLFFDFKSICLFVNFGFVLFIMIIMMVYNGVVIMRGKVNL